MAQDMALGLRRSRGQWLSPPPMLTATHAGFLCSFCWQWWQMSHPRKELIPTRRPPLPQFWGKNPLEQDIEKKKGPVMGITLWVPIQGRGGGRGQGLGMGERAGDAQGKSRMGRGC